ncbi:hypothetical protein AB0H43_02765 [Hamadaea sp. NPDC050747]|uniref:hypothetical protein n=1 Tax=Hamadaea sp. NPDC050747 TaxID=3155789 RepID=UPI0033C300CB
MSHPGPWIPPQEPRHELELYPQPQPTWGPQPGWLPQPVWGPPPDSDKGKLAAGLLQLLLPLVGVCGVGRLYAGHVGIGLTQLLAGLAGIVLGCCGVSLSMFIVPLVLVLITPGVALWSMIDGVVILAGSDFRDGAGRPMR